MSPEKRHVADYADSSVTVIKFKRLIHAVPIPVAERSKARVCSWPLAEIMGSNSTEGINICPMWVVCVVS
jgi:hypothetical protein